MLENQTGTSIDGARKKGWLYRTGKEFTMTDSLKKDNAYFIDHESVAEMGRLLDQDRLYTRVMGGLLPERNNDFSGISSVLDVGSGPGGWAQELAFAYPAIQVTGIDISETMTHYAQAQAQVQHLSHLQFQVMDVQAGIDLPDACFDLVNARLLGFFSPTFWPHLVADYFRLTRPGGIIRLTETEMSFTNSAALEQEQAWFFRALKRAGQSFSANGERLEITAMLAPFLRQAGCIQVQLHATALDWSSGSPYHEAKCQITQVAFKMMEPFLLQSGVATQEEIDQTYQQMLIDLRRDSFAAHHLLVSAWGYKPR
jgi:ubiquinone/menaquinone biosynthesis C-methylase UbiE